MDFGKLQQMAKILEDAKGGGDGRAEPPPKKGGRRRKGPAMGGQDDPEYASKAATAVPANVRMISGCMDAQTSADVHDVSSFGLPDSEGAGGACTNALLLSLEDGNHTWLELLKKMQSILKTKKFTQVPQLSASRQIDLTCPFDVKLPASKRTKALLIGINYVGQQGELKGCHNDVAAMKEYLVKEGYTETPATMKVLLDDGTHTNPTAENVFAAMQWLTAGAQAGDSLFMHYSGHGGTMKDDTGDEHDGQDETLVPVDYQTAGQVRDDDLYKALVAPLPEGVELTILMDCCHSGSIIDLPYTVAATGKLMEAADAGEVPSMQPNENFSIAKLLKVGMELYKMSQGENVSATDLGMHALKSLF